MEYDDRLVIKTKYGEVEGFMEDNLYKWFGIPFAMPPVGERRFKRAIPPKTWEGIKSCKRMGNRPFQFGPAFMEQMGETNSLEESEDCLTLNIWAPKKAEKAPVFIYIYGGANHMGDSSQKQFYLDSFAKQGVIGVSFNYRLGPLGFYDFSKLDPSFESNCAASDMIAAVKWVKENIAYFGGDDENITICGESAGGTGVYALLTAPSARGSFHKAIAMSGLAYNISTPRTHALNNKIFFEKIGIDESEAYKLRTLSIKKLREGARAVYEESNVRYPGILLTGHVLDDLIPEYPWEAMASGKVKDVACMIGTCHDEGSVFYDGNQITQTWKTVEEMLKNNDELESLPDILSLYGKLSERDAMVAMSRDRMFWVGAVKCALAQSTYNNVYMYRYDYATPDNRENGLGAYHGSDIPSGLGTRPSGEGDAFQHKVDACLHEAFVQFAKTGSPNGHLPVLWPIYEEKNRKTFILDDDFSVCNDPNRENYELWKDIMLYE